MPQLPKLQVNKAELKMLRLARKKKMLTIRDYNFWDCEALMHKGGLNKFVPPDGRGAGWPHYKISHRGRRLLEYRDVNPRRG